MIIDFVWSPVFFTLHQIAFALVIILTLLAVLVVFIWVQWRENRFVAALSPLHASLLNYSIYRLNYWAFLAAVHHR